MRSLLDGRTAAAAVPAAAASAADSPDFASNSAAPLEAACRGREGEWGAVEEEEKQGLVEGRTFTCYAGILIACTPCTWG